MLKKIILTGVTLVAITLLSGCASKPKAYIAPKNVAQDKGAIAVLRISNGAGVPSYSANEKSAFKDVLQAAAEITIKQGFKYFAIVEPREISNTHGSLKNKAKELLEACSPNSGLILNIGSELHRCGTYNTHARMKIAMFNKEQDTFTVINAKEVLDYLKAEGIYEDNGLEVIIGLSNEK